MTSNKEFSNVVPELISTYLKQHRRLVIPSLGAFIVKGHDGECDNILFSELLKGDDGVLRGLLIEHGLRDIEAAAMIDRFIFEVKHTTSPEGEEFIIDGIGSFESSDSGKILFKYNPECVAKQDVTSDSQEIQEIQEAGTQNEIQEDEISQEASETPKDQEVQEVEDVIVDSPKEPSTIINKSKLGSTAERRSKTTAPNADDYRAQRIKELYETAVPKQTFREEDPTLKGLKYGKKVKELDGYRYAKHQKPKTDKVLLAAIVAGIVAVGVIAYGYYVSEIVPQGGFQNFWANITGTTADSEEIQQEVNYTSEGEDQEVPPSQETPVMKE